ARVGVEVDPTAVAVLSRRPGEPWFCLEQPDRDGYAVAAIGSVRTLEARGRGRFQHVARRWSALAAGALADAPDGPPGAGLVALGGFAFAPAGGSRVLSPRPPAHYEEAVARAVQRIRAGELEKVVLARDVEVHAPVDHDAGAVLGLLREAFASCYVFAVGRGDAVFLAASP